MHDIDKQTKLSALYYKLRGGNLGEIHGTVIFKLVNGPGKNCPGLQASID